MTADRAKMYFLGQAGCERLNCSQAIMTAFKDEFNLKEDYLRTFKACGGGKAPEGYCGAFYAAKTLLGLREEDKIQDFENYFIGHAGSLKCREIKEHRKLSCVGCVEKSSEFVKNLK